VTPNLTLSVLDFVGGEGDAVLSLYACKTLENILAQASPSYARSFISLDLVATLAKRARPAFSGDADPRGDAHALPRAAAGALSHALRDMLRFSVSDDANLSVEFDAEACVRALCAALDHLGGPRALAAGVAAALASGDGDARWHLVVLNVLNVALVDRGAAERRSGDLRHAKDVLLNHARLAGALVKATSGGRCLAAAVRAKAAVALLQIGRARLRTLGAVVAAPAAGAKRGDTSSAGLVAALERLATRDVHDLKNDRYLGSCVFALLSFLKDAAKAVAAQLARSLFMDGAPRPPELVERCAKDATVFPEGHAWASLDTLGAAASLPLVSAAVASPLLRSAVVSNGLLLDLGHVLRAVGACCAADRKLERAGGRRLKLDGDRPTFFALSQALPHLLDALLSRDGALLSPYAETCCARPNGLLPNVLGLVAAADSRDLRLAAANLVRHTLPSLLARGDAAAAALLAGQLPAAAAEVLGLCGGRGDDRAVEGEILLRLLIETTWPARAAAALEADDALAAALADCAASAPAGSPLVALAAQLLKVLKRRR